MQKFKVGDEVVCACDYEECERYYTVIGFEGMFIEVINSNGKSDLIEADCTISRELYDSPLYKALE